jgi:hypothetical protein
MGGQLWDKNNELGDGDDFTNDMFDIRVATPFLYLLGPLSNPQHLGNIIPLPKVLGAGLESTVR